MSTINDMRLLLGDLPKFDRQTATGDGITKQYVVTTYPMITGTDAVTVAGIAKTRNTDYTIAPELGLITFASAPADTVVIATTFQYAEISDESLAALLVMQPDVWLASSMAARLLAGRYASQVDKQVGDLRISYSQRATAWSKIADKLEAGAGQVISSSSVWAGGISVPDKATNAGDASLVKPFFSRTMMQNPPSDVSREDLV